MLGRMTGEDWTPSTSDAAWFAVAAWVAPATVALTTLVACGLGWATFDPAGAGLERWWSSDAAGAAALDVSSLRTLGLVQLGLALTACIYALPQGLGVALWSQAVPRPYRGWAVVGLTAALLGPRDPLSVGMVVGFSAFVAAIARGRLWLLALGLASLHGLSGLGELLATGPPWAVGWTSPLAWGTAAGLAIVGGLLRR